ncbi:uncharacterized protein LOC115874472 [Sitophilus oryzae]|uniref:Uncharacterized protein LOC115874472 n=1 Tax=Sitophilus oryzae TaxID=7048 RepID=A0A6J2X2Z4_SITOR|nr:uncharacterized protein LOC115874472 [Sitophilus oryzae]
MTSYRTQIVRIWNDTYPHNPKTSQQLSGQIRSVLNRKVFSQAELQALKEEVTPHKEPHSAIQEVVEESAEDKRETVTTLLTEDENVPAVNELHSQFEENCLKYEGIPLQLRDKIPKIKYNVKTLQTVRLVNNILAQKLPSSSNLEETCHLIYSAAITVCNATGCSTSHRISREIKTDSNPPWKRRLESKIMKLREVIGPINSYAQNPAGSSVRLRHRVNNMAKAHDLNINEPAYQQNLRTLLENLKQKISALGAKLRRYNKRVKRYKQNRDFQLNQKLFYRNLATDSQQQQEKPPEKAHMMEYWSEIWSQEENHNKDAYWLRNEEQRNQGIPEMERIIVTAELV